MEYECDKCGACCSGRLIVEADHIDVMREPRLAQADPHYASLPMVDVLELLTNDVGRVVILACGNPCDFLTSDNECEIHPTRPNDCVAMQAGDEQCQQARRDAGLDELKPKNSL